MTEPGIVVVGASYAGLQMAATVRSVGYEGPVTLIGEESHAPYQRPPLSKQLLAGGMEPDALPLKPDSFYAQQDIRVLRNTRISAIDREQARVVTAGGEHIPYSVLGLATGARPRRLQLPGADADGVYLLRTLDDALRIRPALEPEARVVVIGGGFIGLETAATAVKRGCSVTVLEAGERLLARALSSRMASYVEERHRAAGAALRLGVRISGFRVRDGRATGVELDDGTVVEADVVVVGIGVEPNTELAGEAGIACDNGILVDRFGRTSDPAVFAAGDCACHRDWEGGPLRLESVQNANDQGRVAGAAMAGHPKPYQAVPWFWSDQYDFKLQMAGLAPGHDQVVLRGDMEEGRFSLFYLKEGALIAADSVNRPGEHMLARRLLAAGVTVTPGQLADTSVELKGLIPRP